MEDHHPMMTRVQRASLQDFKCEDCKGAFVAGELPDCTFVSNSISGTHTSMWNDSLWRDPDTHFELRCRECSEHYSSYFWDDEAWGPYPFTVQWVKQGRPS